MQETQVQFLGQENPWSRKWQPTLALLPGKSHGQRSLVGYSPWAKKMLLSRKQQPAPALLPGESHGQRSLVGYSPWGCKRVGHDLVTKQQQQSESEHFINVLRLGDQSHERNVSYLSKSRKTLETALIFI